GYYHLLTFLDGPRVCTVLGKTFRVDSAESTLFLPLIRNHTFELPDGLETKIEHYMSALVRPKCAFSGLPSRVNPWLLQIL
ncbi:hypothetical protein L208DRAFT_1279750, partial [Tricholoma matsutake]